MKNLLIFLMLACTTGSFAQELNLPVWTQYLADNDFVLSPTYAGIGDNLRVRLNGLTQWVGIKDAPDNQSLYVDARVTNKNGVGLSLYNDSNGNTRQKGLKVSFSHHLTLDYPSRQFLSFGISYNLNHFRINIEDFQTTYNDPVIDPYVTDDRATSNNNFDVGALYRWGGYYFSFNVNNLLDKKWNDDYDFSKIEPELLRNYQIYTGYVIKSKNNKFIEMEPSIFYQNFSSDGRSTTDVNFKYRKFNRKEDYYWIGASYRFLNDQFFKPLNIGPMAGIMKSKFYFAYSYQITMNDLIGYNSGTHMITIGIDFLQGLSDCPCTASKHRMY